MTGRNINIYLQEDIYNQVRQVAGSRQISRYINEALVERLAREKKHEKERLRQQLIAAYQRTAKSKASLEEDKIWEGTIEDGIENE